MKYTQSRSNFGTNLNPQKSSSNSGFWMIVILVLAVVLTVVIVSLVKKSPASEENVVVHDDMTEETPDVVINVVEDVIFEEIVLETIVEGDWGGVARRGEENGLFSHIVVATLPAIDFSTQYYEGWLVKPRVVEFFSTGEMFPREDGKWGLEWEVGLNDSIDELFDYSEVVITVENRDGDSSPSANHILEGAF